MGVNKNISILMLFDCVRVNTGLGFHRICNSEKKGGICELMDSHHITSRGTIFGRRGCGEFVYHVSYCDERVVMTIYGFQIFLWRQFRGVGLCPYMAYGWRLPIYGSALAPWVFGGTKKPHTLLLTRHETSISGLA
jgi:hypothetical protein